MRAADSPRRVQLVAAARDLLDREGLGSITMRRLGEEVGMRGPSIYKHAKDKADIEAELVVVCLNEQADAVASGGADIGAILSAYRAWALQHPHAHRLLNERPLDRSRIPDGVEERAFAGLLAACAGRLALAQAVWATAKGLVDLELADRFPPGTDVDAAYAAATRAYRFATTS